MTIARIKKESRDYSKDWDMVQPSQKEDKDQQIILVVDDDDKILKLLEVNLSIDGYQVIKAANGPSALKSLGNMKPDLVILDVMMPGLDGYQVLKLIRKQSDVPVILVTASWESISNHESAGVGAENYLKKPFNISELKDIVKTKMQSDTKQES